MVTFGLWRAQLQFFFSDCSLEFRVIGPSRRLNVEDTPVPDAPLPPMGSPLIACTRLALYRAPPQCRRTQALRCGASNSTAATGARELHAAPRPSL